MRLNLKHSDSVVIASRWGGLGDNLQFSTLPRRLKELGKNVYVKSDAYYRNDEIRDVVWGCNPYVDGYVTGPASAGDDCDRYHYFGVYENHIMNVEWSHGLLPESTSPELHYVPNVIPNVKGRPVVDISAISTASKYRASETHLLEILKQVPEEAILVNYTAQIVVGNAKHTQDVYNLSIPRETIDVGNLRELCDLIHTCDSFYCLHSGAEVLATGLRDDGIFSIILESDYRKMKSTGLFNSEKVHYNVIKE